MARYEGKNLVVLVENSSSSEVALTFATAATINFDYADVEFSGDDVKSSQAGQLQAEVIVDYEFDDTAVTGNHVVLGGIDGDNATPRFVRVRPIGTGSGDPQFSMDSVLIKYGPTGVNRDGKIVGQAVFKNHTEASADPTWGTQ